MVARQQFGQGDVLVCLLSQTIQKVAFAFAVHRARLVLERRQLQVEDAVSSPTFSIVNEYSSADGKTYYHFDFYRLRDEFEAMDGGIEEYFESGNTGFIEWASKIANLLPESFLHIHIEPLEEEVRLIHLKHIAD